MVKIGKFLGRTWKKVTTVNIGLVEYHGIGNEMMKLIRSSFFEGMVLRFWGKDIEKNTDECIRVIEETIFDLRISDNEILE